MDEKQHYTLLPLGDSAIVVKFGDKIDQAIHAKVRQLASFLDKQAIVGMVEYVPAFTTVTIFYDPMCFSKSNKIPHLAYKTICRQLESILKNLPVASAVKSASVEIPVCYGGQFGPDLEFVASQNGLTPKEVIKIHSSAVYYVYMIGFAPGFPFLGGMPAKIATSRKKTPRLTVPAGSVGIAGKQTGIYPIATPGGWQLIGSTPLTLFYPHKERFCLLRMGDVVHFKAISEDEFQCLRNVARVKRHEH